MIRWSSPYVAMTVILVTYVVKIAAKLGVGYALHSTMIVGDGWHNVSDVVEAGLVIAMLWLSRQPKSDRYPFGRKNAESLVTLATGIGLAVLAAKLAVQSMTWLVSYLPVVGSHVAAATLFPREQLIVGALWSGRFWAALAVTAGCGAISFVGARYQIEVGRRTGHLSLVADGEETKSDGYVEALAAAGVLSEYLFRMPQLEDAFTLAVAVKLGMTAKELLTSGYRALLQHSLGKEIEDGIRGIAQRLSGVVAVADLKTFKVGAQAVVLLKVHTRASLDATRMLKKALCAKIEADLAGRDFIGSDIYVRFDHPSPHQRRLAYAIAADGGIASSLAVAVMMRICDIADGEVVRARDVPVPPSLARTVVMLQQKRALEVRIAGEESSREKAACEAAGVTYVLVDSTLASSFDCDPEPELP